MRNLRCISLLCFALVCGLFCAHADDRFYVIKKDRYLPLFENDELTRSFESGAKGCNCYKLDTVLLPGSVIKVIGDEKNGMVKVKCEMTKKVKHEGFVYTSSVDAFCEEFKKGDTKRERSPMSLTDIRSDFDRCLRNNVPYCWGSNQFATISLPVKFSENTTNNNTTNNNTTNENTKEYELRGFDCSGLLYYISDGTLPHATGALKDFGTQLFTIKAGKIWDIEFTKEVEQAIAGLKDTDFIVIQGHVIIAYNGGLIEFRSKNLGCCFTSPKDIISQDASKSNEKDLVRKGIKNPVTLRVYDLYSSAKTKNSDVWFVRWHPEYAK